MEKNKRVCPVCMHHCSLAPGERGICRARENRNGEIISVNYGKLTAAALDPIEKKPLRRFHPGSRILSLGSFGCNLRCPFCQNHEISMSGPETDYMQLMPHEAADKAWELSVQGNIGAAFTYNEPLVGYEFVRDTACLIRERGMKNVLVTNGSVTLETLGAVLPWIDAMNIDLKGFTEEYYHWLGGDLKTVLAFIRNSAEECHIELTTLIIPGKNDSEEEMGRLSSWIASVDRDIPLHITRYFPRWKMQGLSATSVDKVYSLAEKAREQLRYVYNRQLLIVMKGACYG